MTEKWFIYQNKQQKGPYSFEQLVQEAGHGLIRPEDLLWSQGMEGWIRADQVEGLFPTAHRSTPAVSAYGDYTAAETKLQQLSSWLGFVGIITIIGGVISAISGLFAFVVGAIPGIITLIMGIKLRKAKKHADAMLAEHDGALASANFEMLTDSLRSYFKIFGILIIIGLALSLLGFIVGLVANFILPDMLGNLIQVLE